VGQKNFNPTVATLIMSLESVFSALTGWLILQQTLSAREFLGCVLIFAAVILAQLPERQKKIE
jgi:drug/metabolite transporter (DMT)-like permease